MWQLKSKIRKFSVVLVGTGLSLSPMMFPLSTYAMSAENAQIADQSLKYMTDEVLVTFKQDKVNLNAKDADKQTNDFANRHQLKQAGQISSTNTAVFKVKNKHDILGVIDKLKADKTTAAVQPNYRYKPLTINTDDPLRADLWGLDNTGQTVNGITGTADADIDAPEAWTSFSGSTNSTIVAIIDSGVEYRHVDLAANMWDGTNCVSDTGAALGNCLHGYDYEEDDKDPLPSSSSHGTHLAGIIGAVSNNTKGGVGVAGSVKIMAIKTDFSTSEIIKGINFATKNGAKIINASWGGYTPTDPLLNAAIANFSGLFITAAGNEANNNDANPLYPCSLAYSNIICVAASDQDDNLATFSIDGSNYGANTVDIAAPGKNIDSTIADLNFDSNYYQQDFETIVPPAIPAGYAVSGTNATPATRDLGGVGGKVIAGDGTTPYHANGNSLIVGPTVDLAGSSSAEISFYTQCDTEYITANIWADYMTLDVSSDGTTYNELARWDEAAIDSDSNPSNIAATSFDFTIPKSYFTSNFKFRFHWLSDGNGNVGTTGAGCMVDDIQIGRYTLGVTESYATGDGTSMATPHVSGAAALVWGLNPNLSPAQVKSIILNSGDTKAAFTSKTVSGKRLNLKNAIDTTFTTGLTVPTSTGVCTGVGSLVQNTNLTAPTVTLTIPEIEQHQLTWNKSTVTAGSVSFYAIYRFKTASNTFDQVFLVNHDNIGDPATYSYTDTQSLTTNTLYSYMVVAFDSSCHYNWTNTSVSSTTTTPTGLFKTNGVWNAAYGDPANTYYAGDFNGDGKGDMLMSTIAENNDGVAGNNDLAWYFIQGTGSLFMNGIRWNASYGVNSDKYYLADFNGDGKDDILISTTRINGNGVVGDNDLAWYLMRSNGSTFVDGGQINKSFGVDSDKYYVADLNGDAKKDVLISTTRINGNGIVGDNDLAWYLMRSNGSTFLDGGKIQNSFGLDADKYYVADFTGDNKDDMLVSTTRINGDGIGGNNDLAWYLMRSNGSNFVDGGQLSNSYGLDADKYLIGDFTGDNKDDIATATTRVNNNGTYTLLVAASTGVSLQDKGTWRKEFATTADKLYVRNFAGTSADDIVISHDNAGTLSWEVYYSTII